MDTRYGKVPIHESSIFENDRYRFWLSKIITATGNFSVQYNFQAISIALLVMSAEECTLDDDSCKEGDQAEWVQSVATATVFIGAIAGQLFMGYAGDVLGRNTAMTLTLSIVVISAVLSAVASIGTPSTVYAVIIVSRFFLGVGVGGVYPLSATKAAEDGGSKGHVDPKSASWAFFWQVPGSMMPWLLAYCFTFAKISAEARWRMLLGFGALPAILVVLCSGIEASLDKKKGFMTEVSSKTQTYNKMRINDLLSSREVWRKLCVTCGGWFLYDIAYYGVNLFGGEILASISKNDDDNISATSSIRQTTQRELIGLSMGLPACIVAIYTLDVVNTRSLQLYGFIFIAVCFLLLAVLYHPLKDGNEDLLFFFYCLLLFSLSYGPNLSTYILPAQVYPKEARATLNGISAASGKFGAFVGVYIFGPVADATSYSIVMAICAVLCLAGACVTYVFLKDEDLADPIDNENSLCANDLEEKMHDDVFNAISADYLSESDTLK